MHVVVIDMRDTKAVAALPASLPPEFAEVRRASPTQRRGSRSPPASPTPAVAPSPLPSPLPPPTHIITLRQVDILINNAGLALGVGTVDTQDEDDMRAMFETNVFAVVALTREVVRGMVARNR